jgi:hypothetical protein
VSNLPHDKHLLGDSAYPLKVNMLVPFRDNGHLNRVEKTFNKYTPSGGMLKEPLDCKNVNSGD